MFSKDFGVWHDRKVRLNSSGRPPHFYEREVWWVAIGHNIGDEEDGKGYNFARPVLIMRKFNKSLFYGLLLSTTAKRGRYYSEVTIKGSKNAVLLSHLRDYDAKRLVNKLTVVSKDEYAIVQKALIAILA
jgi:mRNA interferase MazF